MKIGRQGWLGGRVTMRYDLYEKIPRIQSPRTSVGWKNIRKKELGGKRILYPSDMEEIKNS